jgi:hypothetical protein
MAAQGHQGAFLRPRLSGRYRFTQGTLVGTRGNGRDAPIAAVRRTEIERQGSVESECFAFSSYMPQSQES